MFELFLTNITNTVSDKSIIKKADNKKSKKIENEKTKDDFSKLCEDIYNSLRSYALRLTAGNIYQAEEIIQDTYEYAVKNKAVLLSHSNPKAWFYKTIKIFYMRNREKNLKLENNEKTLNEDITENDDGYIIHENYFELSYADFPDTTILDDIMSQLSEKERELILCQFIDGSSVKEIAKRWNESYEALRKFNYRLMKKIKVLLLQKNEDNI